MLPTLSRYAYGAATIVFAYTRWEMHGNQPELSRGAADDNCVDHNTN
jgi:hypothetical protein